MKSSNNKNINASFLNRKGNIPITKLSNGKFQLLFRINGQRYRPQFGSYDEALDKWKKVKKVEISYDKKALKYDHNAHREYQEASRILGGKMSISELARKYKEASEVAGNDDLMHIAFFYKSHHGSLDKSPLISDAIESFKSTKKSLGISHSYYRTFSFLTPLGQVFEGKTVSEISSNEILNLLLRFNLSPSTP